MEQLVAQLEAEARLRNKHIQQLKEEIERLRAEKQRPVIAAKAVHINNDGKNELMQVKAQLTHKDAELRRMQVNKTRLAPLKAIVCSS